MDINQVRVLLYDNKPMGLRFATDTMVFDVDKSALREFGVMNFDLPLKLELVSVNNMLVSEEDINGDGIEDLSDDRVLLADLVHSLHVNKNYKSLFTYLKPYEMSLTSFMNDDGWRAIPYQGGEGEYNKYHIVQPDRTRWKGKWDNLHRNAELAKLDFHYEQTKRAIYQGLEVSAFAVEEYKDLEYVLESIYDITTRITIKSFSAFEMEVDGRVKQVSLEQYPHTRSAQRDFVVSKKMLPKRSITYLSEDPTFPLKEMIVIALNRSLREYQKFRRRKVI